MKNIEISPVPFVFGDKKFRSFYGPPNENNERRLVGVIDEEYVSKLEDILELTVCKPAKTVATVSGNVLNSEG